MNSFSYLKEELTRLIETIPYIRVRYSFDREFHNHIVEIKPSEVYRNDLDFAESESELCLDFTEKFQYESIIFISEDDAIQMDHPDFVLEGKEYVIRSSILDWFGIHLNEIIQTQVEGVPCKSSVYALAA